MSHLAPSRRILVSAAASTAAAALVLGPSGAAPAQPAESPGPAAAPVSQGVSRAASVTVASMAFSPASVGTTLGGSVTWTFSDPVAHTTTSDQGFWDSRSRSGGATYTRAFTSAGTFAYHCSIHPSMRGKVAVGLNHTGSAASGYKLTWATKKGAGGITYDVQTRLDGGAWVTLRSGTTATGAKFNPAKVGSYSVRARTAKGGKRSGWSPTVTVTIS